MAPKTVDPASPRCSRTSVQTARERLDRCASRNARYVSRENENARLHDGDDRFRLELAVRARALL